ncbi:MAG: hypothetical protein ACRCWQ_07600 [Bacilli bacterium]
MKKLIPILLCCIVILSFVVFFQMFENRYFKEVFYSNSFEITVEDLKEEVIDPVGFIELLKELAKEKNVNISKYVYTNQSSLIIYATDTTFEGKLRIAEDATQITYLTNLKNETDNYSYFYYPTREKKLDIRPIDDVDELGIQGNYIIFTSDNRLSEEITEEFKNVAYAEKYGSYSNEFSLINELEEVYDSIFPFLLLLGVCVFACVLIVVKLILNKSKTIGILALHGYKKHQITQRFFIEMRKLLVVIFCLSNAIVIALTVNFSSFAFIGEFLTYNSVLFISLVLVLIVIVHTTISYVLFRYNEKLLINNLVIFEGYNFTVLIFKYLVVMCALFSTVNITLTKEKLEKFNTSEIHWKQAENVYRIVTNYTVPSSDLEKIRPVEKRAKQLYQQLDNDKKIFLLDTKEYYLYPENKYQWEYNSGKYPFTAKRITVNQNYLNRHPIPTVEGNEAKNELIVEGNILNILVPEKLKGSEKEIREEFLKLFLFQKIEVQQHYHEKINEPKLKNNIADLNIHVIYIKNNLKYFTYNVANGARDNNLIRDNPIVVVDTRNVDDSYYYSRLTHSVYFESENNNPIEDIQPVINKFKMQSSYNSLDAIYNVRAVDIKKTKDSMEINLLNFILLFFVLGFIIYLITAAYFDGKRRTIFIKYTLGFSIIRVMKLRIITEICVYTIILTIFDVPLYYKVLFIVYELLLNLLFVQSAFRKSINDVIKGGL